MHFRDFRGSYLAASSALLIRVIREIRGSPLPLIFPSSFRVVRALRGSSLNTARLRLHSPLRRLGRDADALS